mmetsp:Transcript_33183/g.72489  ORF Transcript_33183/g.72489 Transcript_33183/m.72489 type:complete len:646 (-) Transcript_33183:629-2566(-)
MKSRAAAVFLRRQSGLAMTRMVAAATTRQDHARPRYCQSRLASSRPMPSLKQMTGGELIHSLLVKAGVKQVFGYSGGAVLPLVDAFVDSPIEWYTSSHEQCAGHSAAGAAKATGEVGVCIVTSGPGLTNLVTPLYDAMTDGVPLLVLSGQVPTGAMGTDAFQECPATEITQPCTKWNFVVHQYHQIPWAIAEALRIARSGRPGPVHVDLPKDVLSLKAIVPQIEESAAPVGVRDAPPMLELPQLEEAARLINGAKKPILYVGQGASDCPELVRELAHRSRIPVTTTCHGMGIFDENDPLSLHMLGMHGAAYANFAIQEADLIVAVGSRFDDRTTGAMQKYAPVARAAAQDGTGGIIHMDIRRESFGKVVDPTVALWGDCKHSLQALFPLITDGEGNADREAWLNKCNDWKTEHKFAYAKPMDGKIKTQQVLECLNEVIVDRKVDKWTMATGVGNHQMMSCQFVRWTKPRTFITSGSLGVMGAGLPYAIGVKVAKPDETVILVDGDGSFGMTNMDLQTVARYQVPVKMMIMNDARQQMVWVWQKLFFNSRFLSVTNPCNPDFVKLAEAYGIKALSCDNEADMRKTMEEMMDYKGPVLVDWKVVPDICLPMVAPGKGLDEMMLLKDRAGLLGEDDAEKIEFEGLAPS